LPSLRHDLQGRAGPIEDFRRLGALRAVHRGVRCHGQSGPGGRCLWRCQPVHPGGASRLAKPPSRAARLSARRCHPFFQQPGQPIGDASLGGCTPVGPSADASSGSSAGPSTRAGCCAHASGTHPCAPAQSW